MAVIGGFECHPNGGDRSVPAKVGINNNCVVASYANNKTGEKQLFKNDNKNDVCGIVLGKMLVVVLKQPFVSFGLFYLEEDEVIGSYPCTTFSKLSVDMVIDDEEKVYHLQPVDDILNDDQLYSLKEETYYRLKEVYSDVSVAESLYGVNLDFIKEVM